MRERKKSPMETKLSKIAKGNIVAHDPLSYLWQSILSRAANVSKQVAPLPYVEWQHCLKSWEAARIAAGVEPEVASNRRSGLAKRLAVDSITWANFHDGMQVLASSGRWDEVHFEVRVTPKGGKKDEVFSVRLDSFSSAERKQERANGLIEMGVSIVEPDTELVPNQLYIVGKAWKDTQMYMEPVNYVGKTKRLAKEDEFTGYHPSGSFVMSPVSGWAADWTIKLPIKEISADAE